MPEFCHRCGEELAAGDASFCQHCGAPQLRLPEQEASVLAEAPDTTGVLPPPRPKTIEWKTAILCAAAVALVAAVLTGLSARVPGLIFVSWLWTVSGAAITLGLYQRRLPQAWMDVRIGVRIGIVAGLALIAGIAVAMVSAGVVARFGMHAMGPFDAQMAQSLSQVETNLKNAEVAAPQQAEAMRLIKLPEFRMGLVFASSAMMAGLIMLFSTLGGAMSGMLRMRRP